LRRQQSQQRHHAQGLERRTSVHDRVSFPLHSDTSGDKIPLCSWLSPASHVRRRSWGAPRVNTPAESESKLNPCQIPSQAAWRSRAKDTTDTSSRSGPHAASARVLRPTMRLMHWHLDIDCGRMLTEQGAFQVESGSIATIRQSSGASRRWRQPPSGVEWGRPRPR
jgi:hypothetical protein